MATKKKSSGKKQTKVTTEQRPAKRNLPAGKPKKIVSLAEYEAGVKAEPKAAKEKDPVTMTKDEAVNAAMPAVAEDKKKRVSGLDAAVTVLAEAGKPMNTSDMVKQMLERKLWSTGGKTPASTIYAAIITEIAKKGDKSRFRKTDRGHFELTDFGKEAK